MLGPLHAIVRRFHCHGNHHRYAWDALPFVRTDAGQRLVKLLHRHHRRYLIGATDPDTRFCDFHNHVIHTRHGYWGGAPRVAHAWYARLQRYLRTDRYSDAAHAIGVLSHYFTDPMHPLHTHHDARERILHGPIEWSLHCGYDALFRAWRQGDHRIVFRLSRGPCWLGEAILHGARFAHLKYDVLLDGYDPCKTLETPLAAMSGAAQVAMSDLLGVILTGWARVLERAAEDTESERGRPLADFAGTFPLGLAMARIPAHAVAHRRRERARRLQIMRLLDEWATTGDIRESLPAEVDIVHRVVQIREDEKRWNQNLRLQAKTPQARTAVPPRRRSA